MANFRYVFRYVLLGLPSATECSQVQPSAELTRQVLPKAAKIPNTKGLAAAERNTNNVVVNILFYIHLCQRYNLLTFIKESIK